MSVQYGSDEERLNSDEAGMYVTSDKANEVEFHSFYKSHDESDPDEQEVFVVLHRDAVAALVGQLQSWLTRTAAEGKP